MHAGHNTDLRCHLSPPTHVQIVVMQDADKGRKEDFEQISANTSNADFKMCKLFLGRGVQLRNTEHSVSFLRKFHWLP